MAFLNTYCTVVFWPIGILSPDTSSRCSCDSVVRAPIAPQVIRSAKNWGVMLKEKIAVKQSAQREKCQSKIHLKKPQAIASVVFVIIRIKHLHCEWQANSIQILKQLSADSQTSVDVEWTIKLRIVDESFPSDGGTWLFEVGAHDDEEIITILISEWLQLLSILDCSLGVMDRTWANDDHDTIIKTVDDARCRDTWCDDMLLGLGWGWQLFQQAHWWNQWANLLDSCIN